MLDTNGFADINFADLKGRMRPAKQEALRELLEACDLRRSFFIHNTPISVAQIDDVYSKQAAFNALPDRDKRRFNEDEEGVAFSWQRVGEELAYQPGTRSNCETINFAYENSERFLRTHPEYWPPIDGFGDTLCDYFNTAFGVSRTLMHAFAQALGQDKDIFSKLSTKTYAGSNMRLIRHPVKKDAVEDVDFGIGAHTDFEALTLAVQDQPGLQIRDVKAKEWVDVPDFPVESGRIFVMVDDMLQFRSNGRLMAAPHRSIMPKKERHSIIYFHGFDIEKPVWPMKSLTPGRDYRYPVTTQYRNSSRQHEKASRHATPEIA